MEQVVSKDGTPIAYTRDGAGPAVILVGGGLDDGSENATLVPELALHFTVYNYARRGRGESGDTLPYALEREFEDLEALVAAAGGSAHLYGVSSGGALVLEAAAAGIGERIAVYDVPYCMTEEMSRRAREFVAALEPAVADGRRGDAVAAFMRLTGAPDEVIAASRDHPMWAASEALAHTMPYDVAAAAGYEIPTDRLAKINQPTLVITGEPGADPYTIGMGVDFFRLAADAIAASVPNAERLTLAGQGHVADPKAVANQLRRFFTA